ncbi:hypothetical protein [Sphingobacterium puteale]|uniref:hypothetical protein n=1 Tax=Sphingobacterium puteale TaxID=2420510 RepID=UPI003D97A0DA
MKLGITTPTPEILAAGCPNLIPAFVQTAYEQIPPFIPAMTEKSPIDDLPR